MSANNRVMDMECEYTADNAIEEYKLKPGYSGSVPYDDFQPYGGPGPSGGPKQNYNQETNDLVPKEENEPLFVIDRTKNFRLSHPIQYNNSSNKNKYGKNNFNASRQNSCWNCGSVSHSLHNCPEPRVQWKISKNRQAFIMQKNQHNSGGRNYNNRSAKKNARYFVAGTRNVCSDLIPGKLSDDLLEALGVPKNGLPIHIYRMREHGYPSGWLEEAREEYSGIEIYTAPNECLPLPGRETGKSDFFHCNINEKKLHEYPGFNAPCHPDVVDEGKKFGCPEYNPDQSLKHMYERLKNGQTDKNGIALPGTSSQGIGIESNEGSIQENSLNLKTDEELNNRPPSSPEDGEITEDENNADNQDMLPPSDETVPGIDEQNNSKTLESIEVVQNDSQLNSSNSKMTDSELVSTPIPIRKFGDVKSEILGTPVFKHVSLYTKRPAHENFSKGMVDMIDHENLPNSIGTFKKLKEILKDVRKTINNLL